MTSRKKTFCALIMLAITIAMLFGPFGVRVSNADTRQCLMPPLFVSVKNFEGKCPEGAEDVTKAQEDFASGKSKDSETCGWGDIVKGELFSTACLLRASAGVAEWVIYTPGKIAIGIGGYALDKSADLSINSFATFANSDAVNKGWGLGRDIVNIFLIFILLYIAIATILQLSNFNTKQVLTTLIVVAFLVNFSLVITKLIIDASNILALEFYKSFPQQTSGQATRASLASTFTDAFDANAIVASVGTKQDKNVYLTKLLTFTLGGVILLIAGFIFLVFSVLFLIRLIVLMILMIFSPLAFAAHILPSTRKHASDWWQQLLNQAFFAPAALFMLWISANIANSGFIKKTLGLENLTGKGMSDMLVTAAQSQGIEAGANWDNIIKFILQFIIIAILLCASLIVAKKLGAIGADAVQKGVAKGLRKAQGYAGRIGRNLGTRAAGRASEGLLKGEGRVAQTLKSLPLVSRGLAKASGLEAERKKKQVEKYKKGYSGYSDAGLKALENDPTMWGAKKEALDKERAERAAKTEKEEKAKIRKARNAEEGTRMDELINEKKAEIARERGGRNPDIQKILDMNVEIMKLENTRREREKAELTEELSETVAEMKGELSKVKAKTETPTKKSETPLKT